eukprot:gene25955-biopygen12194
MPAASIPARFRSRTPYDMSLSEIGHCYSGIDVCCPLCHIWQVWQRKHWVALCIVSGILFPQKINIPLGIRCWTIMYFVETFLPENKHQYSVRHNPGGDRKTHRFHEPILELKFHNKWRFELDRGYLHRG